MNKKSKVVIISIIGIVVLGILYFVFLPWAGVFAGMVSSPSPDKPQITYGEFPFKLVYEINGERHTVEDSLICEYAGIGMNEGIGKYREWKGHLASGNENIVLLEVNENMEIVYDPGNANYYMGDMPDGEGFAHLFPDAAYNKKNSEGIISKKKLLSKYGIKLISWDYTKPIANEFITSE